MSRCITSAALVVSTTSFEQQYGNCIAAEFDTLVCAFTMTKATLKLTPHMWASLMLGVVLLQAQTAAIQDLASQLSDSTHVNSRQGAELSAKEAQVEKLDGELTAKQAQVKRLDGELSEQQGQVHQLQTLASEKTSEVERLTPQLAEKQGDIEKREGVMRQFATHLRSSQQQVAAEKQDKDSAVHAYSLVAQVLHCFSLLSSCFVWLCSCTSQHNKSSLGTFAE